MGYCRTRKICMYMLRVYLYLFEHKRIILMLLTYHICFYHTQASMHPSYYYRANACIIVFDVTRKSTYQHLEDWYKEMRRYCENIPCICVANKIDVNYEVIPSSLSLFLIISLSTRIYLIYSLDSITYINNNKYIPISLPTCVIM